MHVGDHGANLWDRTEMTPNLTWSLWGPCASIYPTNME
jgi:hypothetical protein